MTTAPTSPLTPHHSRASDPRPSRAERWAPVSGILFPVFFVGSVVASNVPADSASDRAWLADYTGTRNVDGHLVTAYCLVLAGLSLTVFLATLWDRVRGAQGRTPNVVPVVAAGVAGACMSVGGVLMGVVANSALRRYPEVIRLGSDGGFAMVGVAAMLATSLSVACLSVMAQRAGLLNRTMSILGLVTAALLLAGVFFLPIGALVLWTIAAAIVLLRHPATS